jgi:predicted dehydrogenase
MSLRAGLSGCGAMGRRIVQQVRQHDDCDVVALHDPDPASLHSLREATGIGIGTTSFDELLATGVDFVVLAGPCGVRLDQVRRAAEQSVHCLLHAPMAPCADDAAAMLAVSDAAEIKLGVAVHGHDDPVLDQFRRMIAADWFGGLVLIQGTWGDDEMLRNPPPRDHWRLRPELAGSDPLLRLAAHHVHLATWLSGRPAQQVTAQMTRGFLPLPHDSAVSTAVLRGGVLCTFAASHLTNVRAFAIHGTDGGMRLAGERVWMCGRTRYHGDLFDYADPDTDLVLSRDEFVARLPERRRALELHGRFARWLDDRDDFPCPAEQAVLDLRVLAAMERSAATGCAETV